MPIQNELPELRDSWVWRGSSEVGESVTQKFGTKYIRGGPLAGKRIDGGRPILGGFTGVIRKSPMIDCVRVKIRPVVSINGDDAVEYGFPCVDEEYEEVEQAINQVPELVEEIYERYG